MGFYSSNQSYSFRIFNLLMLSAQKAEFPYFWINLQKNNQFIFVYLTGRQIKRQDLNFWLIFFEDWSVTEENSAGYQKTLKIIPFLNNLKFLNHAKSRRKDLHFKATISSMSIALSQSVGWWNDFKTSECLWTFMQVSGGQWYFVTKIVLTYCEKKLF